MKKLMLAACLMFGGAAFVNAQEQTTPQDQTATPTETQPTQDQTTQDQDKGQEISASELPEGVTASLESQDYSGWTVGSAHKKTDASKDNMEVYVVELKRGTETKKVKFDKDGNKLDEKAKDDQK
jgi:hypothetical protein